jgi:4-amino-4-deoxy-L-arabinose transferase-like glycosyltransferase
MTKDRTFTAAVAALALVACIRVASTHRVFSATLDEPIHLATGYEWLTGQYRIDVTHPPLARILFALPLRNLPPPHPQAHMIDKGNQLLYHGDRYEKHLARGRIGNLVFLIIGIVTVALWARRAFSPAAGVASAALFSTVPAILGHAGLMTTDLSLAAMLPLALFALDLFCCPSLHPRPADDRSSPLAPHPPRGTLSPPTGRAAAAFGIALGFGALSKLSFLVYFPACALVVIAVRRRLPRTIWIAFAIAFLIAWSGYRFDFGKPKDVSPDATRFFNEARLPRFLLDVPMPAPAYLVGLAQVRAHERGGHTAFLLGETSRDGWWYYFPVVLFFKTPLPLLILFAWGARTRRTLLFTLIAAAILMLSMTASLNIGLRHILPIYAPISIVAGYAVVEIWQRARNAFGRIALTSLLVWLFGGVAIAHPDYLAWFNEAAGPHPARIAVDSNLDWGQDVLRLARVVRKRRIERLYVVMNNATRWEVHGIPAEGLPPYHKVSGWVAAGENWLAFSGDEYAWLRHYRPVERVGRSIRLYHIP